MPDQTGQDQNGATPPQGGGQGGPRGDTAGGQKTAGLNAGATDKQTAGEQGAADVERGAGSAAG